MEEESKGGIADMGTVNSVESEQKTRPRINFRIFVLCALGAVFGTFLYARIRFGGFLLSDLLFFAVLLPFALPPLSLKRSICVFCAFLLLAGGGTLSMHLYTEAYLDRAPSKTYEITGTVSLIAVRNGYTYAELKDVSLDGISVHGKLAVSLSSEAVRTGDEVLFTANVSLPDLPGGTEDSYDFVHNIRYRCPSSDFTVREGSFHPILRLNARIYDALHDHMDREDADICYALLTGNSRMVDDGFLSAVRAGGIAHIFAVSGLHIGILYGAVTLILRPLKRYAFAPALALSLFYCALCGFTVSSVRALLMCAALSVNTLLGRKSDLLSSAGFAGTAVLLFLPAQWLSVGFRLSFGACLGLALFSGSLLRGLKRLHLPVFLAGYLSASLSVQLFTFPILLDSFGYFSVWGLLLNLVFVPLLPAAFLTLLLCTLSALAIPPAAGFFLIFPEGLFSLLLYVFALSDFGDVLAGFTLGAATVVWLTAAPLLSERVRLTRVWRSAAALSFVLLFSLGVFLSNSCFGGVTVTVTEGEEGALVLIETEDVSVLLLGEGGLGDAEDFLLCRTRELTAAVVLGEKASAWTVAPFTGAAAVYARDETETGLRETDIRFGDRFSVGELSFRYETASRVTMTARGWTVSFDFSAEIPSGADLSLQKGCGDLKYYLGYGIILEL